MNLEWQQILTHLLGFGIAVWLLKRYAWGPLLSIMEERRNKIVARTGTRTRVATVAALTIRSLLDIFSFSLFIILNMMRFTS